MGAPRTLAEDEALVAMMLEEVLREAGAVVVGPVATVKTALAMIETLSIDAAVLDYALADGNSALIAEALTAREVPFIFTTGFDDGVIDPRYAHVPRLRKVYVAEDLLRAVARILAPS